MEEYIVRMENIQKNFGTVKAVRSGQFNLKKGEIHSIIGENGAGKSTMMKMLYGMYPIDGGKIFLNGQELTHYTTKDAIAAGIGMVHQEFMLVNELTVLENVILGFEPTRGLAIDRQAARKKISQYIETYHMDIQLDKKINQISVGEAQRVEIIKTLSRGANVIILDEPTSVLTPQETEKLFEILNDLKQAGHPIVFISHKLNEVMEISDRITVMRNGEFMGTLEAKDTNERELAMKMVGREVLLNIQREHVEPGETILEVDHIWSTGEREKSKLRDVSFSVRAGEIVGIAGVDGNGQSELAEAIAGLRRVEKGSIRICGAQTENKDPKKIRAAGMSFIPENRNKTGLDHASSIATNLIATDIPKYCMKLGIVRHKEAEAHAQKMIERFRIRAGGTNVNTASLSGGNAQKVIVAREVSANNRFLLASQPTRGVDIGAIEQIRETLEQEKTKGCGILLISTELEEIMSLSDRILVMYEGKISAPIDAKTATEEQLGMLMLGGSVQEGTGC